MQRMRTAIFLLLALASLGAHGAARTPFQVRCEDTISKTVSVLTAQQNGYSIDTHLPYKALTVMKGTARANTWVLGLTKTDSQVQIGLAGPLLQDPASGYECVAPQISVKITYAPVVIYIGREFAPGTCAYDEILAHELRHMKTYMEHLPRVEKTVRAALARRFEARPLYAPAARRRRRWRARSIRAGCPTSRRKCARWKSCRRLLILRKNMRAWARRAKAKSRTSWRARQRPPTRQGMA